MPFRSNLFEDFRMPHGMLTNWEEHGFGAVFCQRLKYGWRIAGPRTVVEGEHHFPVTQEVVGLEMLKSEARSSSGVDFNDTCDAKSLRIAGAWPGVRSLCECPQPLGERRVALGPRGGRHEGY